MSPCWDCLRSIYDIVANEFLVGYRVKWEESLGHPTKTRTGAGFVVEDVTGKCSDKEIAVKPDSYSEKDKEDPKYCTCIETLRLSIFWSK